MVFTALTTAVVILIAALVILIGALIYFIARPVKVNGVVVRKPAPREPDWNWPPRPNMKEQR